MQILGNFFTDTENLFKLLFINGLIMVLVGLFFPLQKRDEIDLKIVEYNKTVKLLNHDIDILCAETTLIKDTVNKRKEEKDKLKKRITKQVSKIEKNLLTSQIKQLQTDNVNSYNSSQKKVHEQDKKVIEVESQKELIDHLQKQLDNYDNYCWAFLLFGSSIGILGLFGWSRLTYFTYDKEYREFHTNNSTSTTLPPIPLFTKPVKIFLIVYFSLMIGFILYRIFGK